MTREFTHIVALSFIVIAAADVRAQVAPAPATQPAASVPDQATLDRQFQETMTGAVLIGYSTDTRRADPSPREERYTIDRVSKIAGSADNWLFTARIPFRGGHLAVPLIIPVKWAGDTPVISVTDLTVPQMGTYTARVLIYRDNYVGTWTGRDCGGHLWGRVERANPTTAPATKPAS
jgi:hypothetical protein